MSDRFRLVIRPPEGDRPDVVSIARGNNPDPGGFPDWPPDPGWLDNRLGKRPEERHIPPAVPLFRHRRDTPPAVPPQADPARVWASLGDFTPDPAHLRRNRMIGATRDDPATAPIDMLRTRLVQTLADRGWSRIAVTAPARGCGATFLATNLALSLARRPSGRVVLVDLDLRAPGLAAALGAGAPGDITEFLTGQQPMGAHLRRIGDNLAIAFNAGPVPGAAELIQHPATADTLDAMVEALNPDVVIYDLPPALGGDDVLAFLPQVEGVLLVADTGRTLAREVAECERLFEGRAALLGVVLNRVPRRRGRRGG
ncbi:MAG: CpsD/CapB family tyrosine-protein kinase [Gemmobacter sp.]